MTTYAQARFNSAGKLCLTTLFLLLFIAAQAQTVRYVRSGATGNGNSWANASDDLQGIINSCSQGDQVWVAAGTYRPGGDANTDRSVSFSMKDGVAVYGGFVGTESALAQRPLLNPVAGQPSSSTLSGNIGDRTTDADNCYHVISNAPGLTTSAVLDGFVVTEGNADGPDNKQYGGGMFNEGSDNTCSFTLRRCLFIRNAASTSGGALYNNALFGNVSPVIADCAFWQNTALGGSGGAIFSQGIYGTTNIRLISCSFISNTALSGGAFFSNEGSTSTSIPVLTNCLFQANSVRIRGGAVAISSGRTQLVNCTFLGNTAGYEGGAIYNVGQNNTSQPAIVNTILFNNGGASSIANFQNTMSATYSLYEPSVASISTLIQTGPGNIVTATSPFVSSTSPQLTTCSPAINTGLGTSPELTNLNTDLIGNGRRNEGLVDMGAYEFQQSSFIPVNISVSPSLTITRGSNVTLTASGASQYRWNTGSTSAVVVSAPLSASVYAVIGSRGGCTGGTRVDIVTTCESVYYVTQNGDGLRNGTSWGNAFAGTSLQTAINQAADCGAGAQVWVASGIYKPTTSTDRAVSFAMRTNVRVLGGFAGTETSLTQRRPVNPNTGDPSSSTLSGEIGSPSSTTDNSYNVLYNGPGTLPSAILDGFVITGGHTSDPSANRQSGGGMANVSGSGVCSPTIQNCLFIANTSRDTGGALSNNGRSGESSPLLTNCAFRQNSAESYGGAIFNNGTQGICSPSLTGCRFDENTSPTSFGGAVVNWGSLGGNCRAVYDHCAFYANVARLGGAVHNYGPAGTSMPQFTNCSFLANVATAGLSVSNDVATPYFVNCIIWNEQGVRTFYGTNSSTTYLTNSLLHPEAMLAPGVYELEPRNLTTTVSPYVSVTSLTIKTCSPAFNTGYNSFSGIGGSLTDLAGNPRTIGVRMDIGAYENRATTNTSGMVSVQNGSWHQPSTWFCGRPPQLGEPVWLQHTVTVAPNTAAPYLQNLTQQLLYRPGGQLRFEPNRQLQVGR